MNKREAKKQIIDKSFICEDKSIHFGKLHVVYIRDVLDMLEELGGSEEDE